MRLLLFMVCVCLQVSCSEPQTAKQAFADGNYETAYNLWRVQAENGDIDAIYFLGVMHYLGLGVAQSNQQAYRHYLQAAKAGHASAQRELGLMYESGRTGKRDLESAYMWLYAAYQQGNPHAGAGLEMLSGQLSPNRIRQLKQTVSPYIVNDTVDPEDDDY